MVEKVRMEAQSVGEDAGRPQTGLLRSIVITMAVVLSVVGALSCLVYPSAFSPLIFAGLMAGVSTILVCFSRPVWALYIAVFIVLLPTGLVPEGTHALINRSLTLVAFVTWLFDAIVSRKRIVLKGSAIFMLGFIFWATLTLFWAEDPSLGLTVVQTYVLRSMLYLFLMVNQIKTKKNLNGLMTVLALDGLVLAVVSIQTILSGGYVMGTRLRVLDVNENALGVMAELALIGVLWQVADPNGTYKPLKMLAATIYLMITIAIVGLSGSRGSAISLLVIMLAFGLWKATRQWAILVLLLLASGFVFSFFATTLGRFISEAGATPLGVRETLWQAAWQLIVQHPVGGVGIGNSASQVLPLISTLEPVVDQGGVSIHNPILVVWSETGILGIILYGGAVMSAIWSFVSQYFRYARLDRFGKFTPYFALVASVFLGYMASWFKGGGMQIDYTYFLLLALLLVPSCLDIKDVLGRDNF